MFRHQMCHPQGACFVTLLNYISTIAALAKKNCNCTYVWDLPAQTATPNFLNDCSYIFAALLEYIPSDRMAVGEK